MKKIHYQHVGFPRTGTTWLWHSLLKNKNIFYQKNSLEKFKTRLSMSDFYSGKENPWQELNLEKLLVDPSEYIEMYKDYDISMNFRPVNYLFEEKVINKISEYTTHVGLTVRNPYEMFSSWFLMARMQLTDFDKPPKDFQSQTLLNWKKYKEICNPKASGNNYYDWINFFIDYEFDILNTVKKWLKFKNNLKIFIYDDLINDREKFYNSVCEFMGIEPNIGQSYYINQTPVERLVNKKYLCYTTEQIERINSQIDDLSLLLNRDFSHWKRLEV